MQSQQIKSLKKQPLWLSQDRIFFQIQDNNWDQGFCCDKQGIRNMLQKYTNATNIYKTYSCVLWFTCLKSKMEIHLCALAYDTELCVSVH